MIQDSLILGLAAGFHYGDLRPFLVSLNQTGCRGACVLFVSPTTRDIERIQSHGVSCVPFQRPPDFEHIPYNAFRYFLYRKYLLENKKKYRSILLTDTRDVIFQQDPFSLVWPQGLHVTLEDRSVRIGDCQYMVRWITHHLGEQALAQLHSQYIACSGTTLGDHDAIMQYLELMTQLLVPFVPGRRVAGYDQGVHNALLYAGKLCKTTVHDNAGPILTLGYKSDAPQQDDHGDVLNENGRPAMLVHQYDRHNRLFQSVRERFR